MNLWAIARLGEALRQLDAYFHLPRAISFHKPFLIK